MDDISLGYYKEKRTQPEPGNNWPGIGRTGTLKDGTYNQLNQLWNAFFEVKIISSYFDLIYPIAILDTEDALRTRCDNYTPF